jgi:predicted dehydrogenase
VRADGTTEKHYYVKESVGLATGFLLAALHHAGLATLTHTPSPMGFLREVLGRPAHEQAFVLIVTGVPAAGRDRADDRQEAARGDRALRGRRMAEWIAAGAIGEVLHAHVTHTTPGWAARDGRRAGDWKALAERGGGLLGAHGSHQVDLLRWWFGPVVAAFARLETLTPDRVDPDTGAAWTATADDFVHLLTEHDRCRHADVRLSAVAPVAHDNATVVHGREGTLLLRHEDESLHVARPRRRVRGRDPARSERRPAGHRPRRVERRHRRPAARALRRHRRAAARPPPAPRSTTGGATSACWTRRDRRTRSAAGSASMPEPVPAGHRPRST